MVLIIDSWKRMLLVFSESELEVYSTDTFRCLSSPLNRSRTEGPKIMPDCVIKVLGERLLGT